MVSDGIEIMHITVIEHTISQIYRVYKDMNVKMIGIFMDGEDNLILCVRKDFTYLFSNLICLQFTVSSGLHSVLERPFSEANGRSFLVKRSPLIVC